MVQVAYSSRDKNPAADSVDLFYAGNRQGPWVPIAKGLKTEGQYRWVPPAEAGQHAYLRMTVRDQAGNTNTAETPQPVVLDDLSRPRGQLLGISATTPPAPGRPALAPHGN